MLVRTIQCQLQSTELKLLEFWVKFKQFWSIIERNLIIKDSEWFKLAHFESYT